MRFNFRPHLKVVIALALLFFESIQINAQYCTPSGSATWGHYISEVTFPSFSNTSAGQDALNDYTSLGPITVIQGQTYSVDIGVRNSWGGNDVDIRVWIDWDNNDNFTDVGDLVVTDTWTNAGDENQVFSYNITVPPGASIGDHRMRVANSWRDGINNDGCESGITGEYEDYTITVVAPVTYCASNATNSAGSRIESVSISNTGGWNYTDASGCETYTDNTASGSPVLYEGLNYDIDILVGTCDATTNQSVSVYMDWDRNGDFDGPNELLGTSAVIASGDTYSLNFDVPAGATVGAPFGMRIITIEDPGTHTNSCDIYTNGETEDYLVSVVPIPSHCIPSSTFSGNTHYINYVHIGYETLPTSSFSGNIINTSTADGQYYHDYTNMVASLYVDRPFRISPNHPRWRDTGNSAAVWVDWNMDGDFDDPGEEIANEMVINGSNGYLADIPANINVDDTVRVRVAISQSDGTTQLLSPCGYSHDGGSSYGEWEDYLVTFIDPITMPVIPPGVAGGCQNSGCRNR